MKMKKRALTLLEIIIVIFLISLITGAIGYSMKGTLDKGRAFRTKQAIQQLHDLLLMCVAEGDKINEVVKEPERSIRRYGLAKNPSQLVEDGWGNKLVVKLDESKTDFVITSSALNDYETKTGRSSGTAAAK